MTMATIDIAKIKECAFSGKKKPKGMSNEEGKVWEREKARLRVQRFRKNNHENERSRLKAYRLENKERLNADKRAWAKKNSGQAKERVTKWRILTDYVSEPSDLYVAGVLKLPIKTARQYPELIEAHRTVIRLKRKLRTPKKHEKSN